MTPEPLLGRAEAAANRGPPAIARRPRLPRRHRRHRRRHTGRRQEAAATAETAGQGAGPALAAAGAPTPTTTSDLSKRARPLHRRDHAASSHQACRRLRSVKELKGWVAERMATARKKGLPLRHVHVTRMTPKRDAGILVGGCLRAIKGEIAAREKIIAIEPFATRTASAASPGDEAEGLHRLTAADAPVQGRRHLAEDAAPPDLMRSSAASVAAMLEPMRRELRDWVTLRDYLDDGP